MEKGVNEKEEISLAEFRAWLAGYLHGKPKDSIGWIIQDMAEKVVPDVEIVKQTEYVNPLTPIGPAPRYPTWKPDITCATSDSDVPNTEWQNELVNKFTKE